MFHRRLLEGMPPPINKAGDVIGIAPPPYTIDAALPLDGWRDPIIFVPPGGIHVWMTPTGDNANLGEFVVRTSGTYPLSNLPPVGPNDRPFFASAGQNGIFTNAFDRGEDFAIDNLYSFQEQ